MIPKSEKNSKKKLSNCLLLVLKTITIFDELYDHHICLQLFNETLRTKCILKFVGHTRRRRHGKSSSL